MGARIPASVLMLAQKPLLPTEPALRHFDGLPVEERIDGNICFTVMYIHKLCE